MSDPATIARAIEALSQESRSGTLRIWGEWFGGKPYDNFHKCLSCESDAGAIVLIFDGGETLRVENPEFLEIHPKSLSIRGATRVRLEWHYYGRPKTPDNRKFLEYCLSNGEVVRTSSMPRDVAGSASISSPAIELVRV